MKLKAWVESISRVKRKSKKSPSSGGRKSSIKETIEDSSKIATIDSTPPGVVQANHYLVADHFEYLEDKRNYNEYSDFTRDSYIPNYEIQYGLRPKTCACYKHLILGSDSTNELDGYNSLTHIDYVLNTTITRSPARMRSKIKTNPWIPSPQFKKENLIYRVSYDDSDEGVTVVDKSTSCVFTTYGNESVSEILEPSVGQDYNLVSTLVSDSDRNIRYESSETLKENVNTRFSKLSTICDDYFEDKNNDDDSAVGSQESDKSQDSEIDRNSKELDMGTLNTSFSEDSFDSESFGDDMDKDSFSSDNNNHDSSINFYEYIEQKENLGFSNCTNKIKESLEDKVKRLRIERLIVEEKICEAKEEDRIRREEKLRFQKQLLMHRKQILMRTLQNLRERLENQSERLQVNYSSVLNMQRYLKSQKNLPESPPLPSNNQEAPF